MKGLSPIVNSIKYVKRVYLVDHFSFFPEFLKFPSCSSESACKVPTESGWEKWTI